MNYVCKCVCFIVYERVCMWVHGCVYVNKYVYALVCECMCVRLCTCESVYGACVYV